MSYNKNNSSDSKLYANEIYTEKINTKNKLFIIDLKKNNAGYFVKLSEISNNKKSFLFVPEQAIDDVIQSLQKIKETIKNDNTT